MQNTSSGQYAPQGYQQGYQQMRQATPAPAANTPQEVKFYKSSIFGFASAAGKTERETARMLAQGWRIQEVAFLGIDFWLRRIVMVVYNR